ncbi:cation-transporting P-type ATPase [Trichlorobacter lovleyi]|uniref:cation-transporting P-type ATPase n=1 Tax=Trichlorobacter lovleyi TaxID=313985 RepID=UPI00223FED4F|nr:cation-transporting P-type ATPase [Trichlorobacter lovleyi]
MNSEQKTIWHTLGVDQALEQLQTVVESGLTAEQADRRLQQYGQNELTEQAGRSPWQILWEQFTSTMALILTAAAVVSGLVGSFKDAGTIFAIVILFALLGFAQDFRAERAIAALKRMAVPLVRVRRDMTVQDIPSSQLVPGDVVLLEAGSVVPADCRLLEAHGLRVQESLLVNRNLLFRCRLYTTGNGITSMDYRDFWGEIGNYPGRFWPDDGSICIIVCNCRRLTSKKPHFRHFQHTPFLLQRPVLSGFTGIPG